MGRYEERYADLLKDIAKGKGELTGVQPAAEGFPRYEHSTHAVHVKKGGLLSRGGTSQSDQLILDLMLGDGWEIAGVQGQPEFVQFYLQRRHERNCQCADCQEWRQFRSSLPTST